MIIQIKNQKGRKERETERERERGRLKSRLSMKAHTCDPNMQKVDKEVSGV